MKSPITNRSVQTCGGIVAAFVCSVLMSSPLLPISAEAQQSGDFTYMVTNGTAIITGYTGAGGNVVIPTAISGFTVTSIGDGAFDECGALTSITLPDSVSYIGNSAFDICSSLTNINIPNGVTSIGDRTFYSTALRKITIPDGVTNIGDEAFDQCGNLSSINIPTNVTSIGAYAFSFTALTSITIPSSVNNIGWNAFGACLSLSNVYFEGNSPTTQGGRGRYSSITTWWFRRSRLFMTR